MTTAAKTIAFDVKNRWTGEVQFTAQIAASDAALPSLKLGLAVKWAVKEKIDLRGAYLSVAYLRDAYLRGAYLSVAYLRDADLRDADLRDAYLRDADLRGANLSGANLSGAKEIGKMVMPEGLTFEEYRRDVVPALLTAGGKTMDEIKASGCWDCHTWENCPMHVAFGVGSVSDLIGPYALHRPRAEEFIRFFDAGLIPAPWADGPVKAEA